ncbi:MAG: winged helix-turn-helix transcriptional regulator [Nanobdellota archaeon]
MSRLIDEYDKKILSILDDNAREKITKIAKKVRLAKETVNYRINRLVDKGIIKKFNLIINTSKLGFNYYMFFLKFNNTDPKIEHDFIVYLRKKKNCSNLRFTEGAYDVSFLLMFKNIKEFEQFYEDLNNRYGNYIASKSFHMLTRSYKFHNKIFKNDKGEQKILDHTIEHKERLNDNESKILDKLLRDPKAKLTDISAITNIPPKVVAYNLKKLEEKDIISAYSINIDIYKFNYELVLFNLSINNLNNINKIIEFFKEKTMSSIAYKMIGEFDISFEINIRSDIELRNIIDNFRTEFKGDFNFFEVLRIFRDYDTNWSPLEDNLIE